MLCSKVTEGLLLVVFGLEKHERVFPRTQTLLEIVSIEWVTGRAKESDGMFPLCLPFLPAPARHLGFRQGAQVPFQFIYDF